MSSSQASASFSADAVRYARDVSGAYFAQNLPVSGPGSGSISTVSGTANQISSVTTAGNVVLSLAPPSPAPVAATYSTPIMTVDALGRVTSVAEKAAPTPTQRLAAGAYFISGVAGANGNIYAVPPSGVISAYATAPGAAANVSTAQIAPPWMGVVNTTLDPASGGSFWLGISSIASGTTAGGLNSASGGPNPEFALITSFEGPTLNVGSTSQVYQAQVGFSDNVFTAVNGSTIINQQTGSLMNYAGNQVGASNLNPSLYTYLYPLNYSTINFSWNGGFNTTGLINTTGYTVAP